VAKHEYTLGIKLAVFIRLCAEVLPGAKKVAQARIIPASSAELTGCPASNMNSISGSAESADLKSPRSAMQMSIEPARALASRRLRDLSSACLRIQERISE